MAIPSPELKLANVLTACGNSSKGPIFKSSESSFFTEATDATFGFSLAPEQDKALSVYGTLVLNTLQGAASATLFTPSDDLTGDVSLKTLQSTSFNWKTIDLSKSVTLSGEIVLRGKQKKITVSLYQPSDGTLVAALIGDVAAGYTGFVRTASFTWSLAAACAL